MPQHQGGQGDSRQGRRTPAGPDQAEAAPLSAPAAARLMRASGLDITA
jgi:hypothetical protein